MVGKRLGVVGRSPRNIELLKVILRQYRITADQLVMLGTDDLEKPNEAGKIGVIQFDPNNVASAIKDSNVDVIMSVGPVGSPITADADRRRDARQGSADVPPDRRLRSHRRARAGLRIERDQGRRIRRLAATAGGKRRDHRGASLHRRAEDSSSEQVAADFTKHLFAIRQTLAAELPSAAKIEKPDTDKDAAVPVHPGAAAYLDGELKTLLRPLQRFALLGPDGDVGARFGLRRSLSYSKADDRVRKLRTLERLLESPRRPEPPIRLRPWTTCRPRSTPSRPT